ncbi:MAG: DUF4406 domain-containing protein [Candidatus Nanopelagicales bacterium]
MKRLYLSGPMSGFPSYNFPAFNRAAHQLRTAGYEVCNPAELLLSCGCQGSVKCGPEPHEWHEFLRADLVALLQYGEAVATLEGWANSKGAQLEIHVARTLGWEVQPVGHWLGEAAVLSLREGELLRANPGV